MVIQKNISTDVNNEPVNNSLIGYAKDDQKEKQNPKDFNPANPIVPIIIKHQNSVFDGLFDEEYNNIDDSLVLLVIRNGNFDSFFKFIDKIFTLCQLKKIY